MPLTILPDCGAFLENRLSQDDKRYATFKQALELVQESKGKILVETGTARGGDKNFIGDGGSTIIFSDFSAKNNCSFYSVDINRSCLLEAKNACKKIGKKTYFIHSDSLIFLKNFKYSIDFLYLDSFDYDENNPLPSQIHHLKEIEEAYPHLSENCLILIDDCDLPNGGKGKIVVEYLLNRGWKILINKYQILMSRK